MAAPNMKVFELFVSKIPWTLATKELKNHFGQFGTVKKCLLPFEKGTGFHKGFAWITFSSEEGQINALQHDSHVIDGSRLAVQKNRRPFLPTGRNKETEEI
ncbi:SRA stem-loop-interacting RNA-binding protein, mitochondrial [Astyanax mexicanus]|uniref:SRA stem-loop-interacting RNA-binding protein, mitochondrial n=2 Tax=Astyanax mexicanus TaxID=7994 RepID=A0A8B9HVT7_ASTMX|nr:SRA stem-loop-interacting RNA-binding protein, mitochondrial [Astyanax mexicanus]KAG9268896.1 SRA stem-loop-interacting RNA-binding protein, mitochondrial [Astyanax mexicanus]